jgi:hypothetical protein
VKADGKQNSAYSLTLKMEAMFLRNVGWISMDSRRYIPEDSTLHNLRCQNLKSYNQLNILGNFLETNFLPFSTTLPPRLPHITTALSPFDYIALFLFKSKH